MFTGVTETLHMSTERLDRLPFHLDRWKQPMSIAIQMTEEEISEVVSTVFQNLRNNIRYTFYIIQDSPENQCYFVNLTGQRVYHDSCYDMNVLRNLAIETIQTSHFLLVDGDGLLSVTLQDHYQQFQDFMSFEKNVLLFPTIGYLDPKYKNCKINGNCNEAWKSIPRVKSELITNTTGFLTIKRGHYIIHYNNWKREKGNVLVKFKPTVFMEPYGIFKRTKSLPLFHPYFYNYGRNKEEYYRVLNTMKYNYKVMSLDFAVDLPHPRSEYDKEVREKISNKLNAEYVSYFDEMYKAYCEHHKCLYFSE